MKPGLPWPSYEQVSEPLSPEDEDRLALGCRFLQQRVLRGDHRRVGGVLADPIGGGDDLGHVLTDDRVEDVRRRTGGGRPLVHVDRRLRGQPDHGLDVQCRLTVASLGRVRTRSTVDVDVVHRNRRLVAALVDADIARVVRLLLQQRDRLPGAQIARGVQAVEPVGGRLLIGRVTEAQGITGGRGSRRVRTWLRAAGQQAWLALGLRRHPRDVLRRRVVGKPGVPDRCILPAAAA